MNTKLTSTLLSLVATCVLGSLHPANAMTVSVRPEKLRVNPDEPQQVRITVKDLPAGQKTAEVSWRVLGGLGEEVATAKGTTDEKGIYNFTFTPKTEWGYAVEATAIAGDTTATGMDVFACARNPLTVTPSYGISYLMGWAVSPEEETSLFSRAQKIVERSREAYAAVNEIMPMYYDSFAPMVPPEGINHYICDQGSPAAYRFTASVQKEMFRLFIANGIQPISYANSQTSGYGGTEFLRQHPELVICAADGTPKSSMSTVSIPLINEYYRTYPASLTNKTLMDALGKQQRPYGFDICRINFENLDAVTRGAQSLIDGQKFFGIQGVRFDGHYSVPALGDPIAPVSECFDFEGRSQPTGTEGERLTARNMLHAIDMVRSVDPDFIFGFNYASIRNDQLGDAGLSSQEAQAIIPGNLILDEVAKSALNPTSPEHKWPDFIANMSDQVDRVRKLGGYLVAGWGGGPCKYEIDTKQCLAVSWACGLRWIPGGFEKVKGSDRLTWEDARSGYARFTMRYSEFILNNALHRLPVAEAGKQIVVNASRPLFWDHFVQRLETPTGSYLVMHLINQPLEEGLTVDAKAPPAATDVKIEMASSVFNGKTPRWDQARVLSPDLNPVAQSVQAVESAQGTTLSLPPVAIWSILVVPYE
jgi:hypothetical protein